MYGFCPAGGQSNSMFRRRPRIVHYCPRDKRSRADHNNCWRDKSWGNYSRWSRRTYSRHLHSIQSRHEWSSNCWGSDRCFFHCFCWGERQSRDTRYWFSISRWPERGNNSNYFHSSSYCGESVYCSWWCHRSNHYKCSNQICSRRLFDSGRSQYWWLENYGRERTRQRDWDGSWRDCSWRRRSRIGSSYFSIWEWCKGNCSGEEWRCRRRHSGLRCNLQ